MNHEQLLETESHWLTRIGKAFLTERVVMHGKDLHHELDHLEWLHLYLYCILGKDPGENVAKMLNSYWVGTTLRLWQAPFEQHRLWVSWRD